MFASDSSVDFWYKKILMYWFSHPLQEFHRTQHDPARLQTVLEPAVLNPNIHPSYETTQSLEVDTSKNMSEVNVQIPQTRRRSDAWVSHSGCGTYITPSLCCIPYSTSFCITDKLALHSRLVSIHFWYHMTLFAIISVLRFVSLQLVFHFILLTRRLLEHHDSKAFTAGTSIPARNLRTQCFSLGSNI